MADEKQDEPRFEVPLSAIGWRVEQHRVQKERYRTIYANNIAVTFSIFDVGIIFGEIIGEHEDGQPIIEELTRVTLTRELTKALTAILLQHLKAWEKQVGEIKIPDLGKVESESDDVVDASGKEIPVAS
jgi:hypothetical protein